MEFSTEELKPLADRLAEMVSRELANGTEDATVRDIETALRRQLLKMGRLALGEVFSQPDVNRERSIACDCRKGKTPLDEKLGLAPGQVTAGLAALLGLAGNAGQIFLKRAQLADHEIDEAYRRIFD